MTVCPGIANWSLSVRLLWFVSGLPLLSIACLLCAATTARTLYHTLPQSTTLYHSPPHTATHTVLSVEVSQILAVVDSFWRLAVCPVCLVCVLCVVCSGVCSSIVHRHEPSLLLLLLLLLLSKLLCLPSLSINCDACRMRIVPSSISRHRSTHSTHRTSYPELSTRKQHHHHHSINSNSIVPS